MRLRSGMIVLAVALALGVVQETAAQVPPHQFYGSSERGSSALVNGRVAPDGWTVAAVNQKGVVVASTVVAEGDWVVRIDTRQAREVRFRIGGSELSEAYAVTSGALTEVRLALTAAVAREPRTVPPKPGLELYTVREGDTLESIAAAAALSTAELLERNPQLEDADDIAKGDVIYLRELVTAPAPVEEAAPAEPLVPVEPPVALPEVEETPEPAPAVVADVATDGTAGGGGGGLLPVAVVGAVVVGAALAVVALRRRRGPAPPAAPEPVGPEPPVAAEASVPASGLARLRQEQQQQSDRDEVFQVRYDLHGEEGEGARSRGNYLPPADPALLTAVAADVVAEEPDGAPSDAAEAPTALAEHAPAACVAQTAGGRRCADRVRGAGLTLCPAHDRLARTGGTVVHWESGQAITEAARAEGSAAG